jgi:hypothetical protein
MLLTSSPVHDFSSSIPIENCQGSSNMTGFLDLPLELRDMVYNNVLERSKAGDHRVFWTFDGMKVDSHMNLDIPFTRRSRRHFRVGRPSKNQRHRGSSVSHRDISLLVSLAQTCQTLYDEVLSFAWPNSDTKAQGTIEEVCGLLAPRFTLSKTPIIKNSIKSLDLFICNPWEQDSYKAMQEIIKNHLPTLTRLDLSVPHMISSPPGSTWCKKPILDPPAKAVFAHLHRSHLESLVVFQVYDDNSGCVRDYFWIDGRNPSCDEIAALLRDTHDLNRTKAVDRQCKKQDRELFDLNYYLVETVVLRSIGH